MFWYARWTNNVYILIKSDTKLFKICLPPIYFHNLLSKFNLSHWMHLFLFLMNIYLSSSTNFHLSHLDFWNTKYAILILLLLQHTISLSITISRYFDLQHRSIQWGIIVQLCNWAIKLKGVLFSWSFLFFPISLINENGAEANFLIAYMCVFVYT